MGSCPVWYAGNRGRVGVVGATGTAGPRGADTMVEVSWWKERTSPDTVKKNVTKISND